MINTTRVVEITTFVDCQGVKHQSLQAAQRVNLTRSVALTLAEDLGVSPSVANMTAEWIVSNSDELKEIL